MNLNFEIDLSQFYISYSYVVEKGSLSLFADIIYGADPRPLKNSIKNLRNSIYQALGLTNYLIDDLSEMENIVDGLNVPFLKVCLNPTNTDAFADKGKKYILSQTKDIISEILLNSIDSYKSFKEELLSELKGIKFEQTFSAFEETLNDDVRLLLELKED